MRKLLLMLLTVIPLFTACDKNDDDDSFRNKQYTITEVDNSGISGVVMIREYHEATRRGAITISIEGIQDDSSYLPNLYYNSLIEGGEIAISLEEISNDFSNIHVSNTIIYGLDPNEESNPTFPISYDELITFDGHILIRLNGIDGPVVAAANIGSNAN
ncbi:hypothetical protein [uncultured Aquimarina sp.]|uniref:hypothetical protein n=1 Tax=uncultured Aquimarina sp. TaxID=575652 RepID=UPI002611AF14|nr:hypothetical protein [uncultured Aquimarina sp.]